MFTKLTTLKVNLIAVVFIALGSSLMTVATAMWWDEMFVSNAAPVPQTLANSTAAPPNLAASVLECGSEVYSPVQKRCVDQATFDQEMARLFAALGLDSKLYQTQGE